MEGRGDGKREGEYPEDMVEEALRRILEQDPQARLVRNEAGGLTLEAREARLLAADPLIRSVREDLIALTTPLLGSGRAWEEAAEMARRQGIGEGGAEVHLDPVFGWPLALPLVGPEPVERARGLLAGAPFYRLVVVEEGREMVYTSAYWLGELAPPEILRRRVPHLAERVLKARRGKGGKRAGEILAAYLYGETV